MPSTRTSERSASARTSASRRTAAAAVKASPASKSTPAKKQVRNGKVSKASTVSPSKGKGTSSKSQAPKSSKVIYKDDDEDEDDGSDNDSADEGSEDQYVEDENSVQEEGEESLDSDDLDADDSDEDYGTSSRRSHASRKKNEKRSAASTPSKRKASAKSGSEDASGRQSFKKAKITKDDDEDPYSDYTEYETDSDLELEEGQEIAGRIVPAPTKGHVPPGRVSRNTFKFLNNMMYPERNDREWFKMHEPAYRLAEKEWVAFVSAVITRFRQVDPELPAVPPKDLILRIYRDVRFSNDKTPYKKNFSMSICRSGRKGVWAGFQPRGGSMIAGGKWAPEKNEIASIRHRIQRDADSFKAIINAPKFVKLFGPARPQSGERSNVFGHDDMLKTRPKGIDKDHPLLDYLKLRSIAVVHRFEDEEVLQPKFMDRLMEVVATMRPLVHWLNEAIAIPAEDPE